MELCIQLSIIMVGKQFMNTLLEMGFPLFFKWLNLWRLRTDLRGRSSIKKNLQWVKDFKLIEWGPRGLFPEYLEMGMKKILTGHIFELLIRLIFCILVLQYGFVTIFVAAFPLAPFFALLNNIFEMRLDAKKLLTYYRRPVTQRVRDIGVWFKILNSIGKLAVITNVRFLFKKKVKFNQSFIIKFNLYTRIIIHFSIYLFFRVLLLHSHLISYQGWFTGSMSVKIIH